MMVNSQKNYHPSKKINKKNKTKTKTIRPSHDGTKQWTVSEHLAVARQKGLNHAMEVTFVPTPLRLRMRNNNTRTMNANSMPH
jgi:hypothetical protein